MVTCCLQEPEPLRYVRRTVQQCSASWKSSPERRYPVIEWLFLSKILAAIPCLVVVVGVIETFLDYVDI
jgi:hypothetical protein